MKFGGGIKRNRRRNWRVEFISMRRIDAAHGSPHNFRHSFNQTADHLEKNRRNPRRWKEREHVNLDPYSEHDSGRSTGNPCKLYDSLFDDFKVIIKIFFIPSAC